MKTQENISSFVKGLIMFDQSEKNILTVPFHK